MLLFLHSHQATNLFPDQPIYLQGVMSHRRLQFILHFVKGITLTSSLTYYLIHYLIHYIFDEPDAMLNAGDIKMSKSPNRQSALESVLVRLWFTSEQQKALESHPLKS